MPIKLCCDTINYFGLKSAFRAGCFGSSRSGKTTAIFNLLRANLIDHKFKNIYFCSPSLSKHPETWEDEIDSNFVYLNEIPGKKCFENVEQVSLLIIEDFWVDACKSEEISNLFKVYSGKLNLSVFITCQNPFEGKFSKTIRNNLNYFLLFKNLGDVNINNNITRQLGLYAEYKEAESRMDKYGFVFVNMDLAHCNSESLMMKILSQKPLLFK